MSFLNCLCGESDLLLSIPLGENNIKSDTEWLANWDWFIDQDTRLLYHHERSDTCVVHSKRGYSHYSHKIVLQVCARVLSGELWRTTIYKSMIEYSSETALLGWLEQLRRSILLI